METIEVTLTINVPYTNPPATPTEIREWVYFNVGHRASININNPLVNEELNGHIEDCNVN